MAWLVQKNSRVLKRDLKVYLKIQKLGCLIIRYCGVIEEEKGRTFLVNQHPVYKYTHIIRVSM